MKKENENKKSRWPYAIVMFFAVIFMANIALFYMAYTSDDGLTDEDYYLKGLNYDARKKNAEQLGWQFVMDFEQTPVINKDATLVLNLLDRSGAVLEGANVVVTVRRPTTEKFDKEYSLKRDGDKYSAKIVLPNSGNWDLRFHITRDENKLEKTFRIEV